MSGSNTTKAHGVYGTLGTASANNVPGARDYSVSWTDSSDNLWLFGGYGYDATGTVGELNDLWEFNPTTKEWTWVSGASAVGANGGASGVYGILGVAAAGNVPGGRQNSVRWTDSGENLWLFGGSGSDSTGASGSLNDLWEFDPTTKEWTWVSGANNVNVAGVYGTLGVAATGNVPGGRNNAVSWIDGSGNLWLFGGYGYDATGMYGDGIGELNDLWEFNLVSKEWTWVSGSNAANNLLHSQPGVYGTLGVAAAGNVPGARDSAVSWTDRSGNLWLFGGEEVNMFSGSAVLNDLWKFDPATKEWTWVSGTNTTGSNTPNPVGIYGTLDVAATGNVPGGRVSAVSWIDSSGNLWLFGGWGFDATGTWRGLNDLWRFSPATREWTWVSGSNTVGSTEIAPGVYGTLGTAAAGNVPGGRYSAVSWIDGSGDLWLFGGIGFDSIPKDGYLNDLWKYQP